MKLKNLLIITLSVIISAQTVLGVTYKTAKSKEEPFNIPSIEEQQETINKLNKKHTISYLLSRGASGKRVADGEFVVEVESKVIDGYAGLFNENVVIPSTLAGVNIERIGERAFAAHYNLKSVTLPEGLKVIENKAFEECYNLESVTIPSTVEEIHLGAFYGVDTIYLPYHTPEQLNGIKYTQYETNEIFGAKRAVYGTGDNQIIIEDKNLTEPNTTINDKTNTTTQNTNSKSVQLQVGSKVATVNGSTVALDTPAYINKSNNSVYVPLRFVSVALVGEDNMMWDANTKTVAIFKDNKSIKFTVGNNNMIIDGKSINMGNSIVPELKEGRVFVPFRPLGEALGMNVNWDGNTKTAIYN